MYARLTFQSFSQHSDRIFATIGNKGSQPLVLSSLVEQRTLWHKKTPMFGRSERSRCLSYCSDGVSEGVHRRTSVRRYVCGAIFFRFFRLLCGVLDCLPHEAVVLHRHALCRPDYSMNSSRTLQQPLHLHRYSSWALEP